MNKQYFNLKHSQEFEIAHFYVSMLIGTCICNNVSESKL
jgi:hypothetical protein